MIVPFSNPMFSGQFVFTASLGWTLAAVAFVGVVWLALRAKGWGAAASWAALAEHACAQIQSAARWSRRHTAQLPWLALWVVAAVAGTLVLTDATASARMQAQPAPAAGSQQQPQPQPTPGASPNFQSEVPADQQKASLRESPLWKRAAEEFGGAIRLNQGGALWLGLAVAVAVAFNPRRKWSWRNADLLLLLVPSFLFLDITRFSTGLTNPSKFTFTGMVFTLVFLITAVLFVRALVGAFTQREAWTPNLPAGVLAALLVALVLTNLTVAFFRNPDDCGIYTNLGTRRMLDTGKYPYGDPLLRKGAAATYGPALYLAHIPFQLVLGGGSAESDSRTTLSAAATQQLRWPPLLATKLTVIFFHLVGVLAFLWIGRQLGDSSLGLALACLYAGSAYVNGVGGDRWVITGMAFISHIAPAAVTLLAFAFLKRPFVAGCLLGVGAGLMFYPAFFFPLWFGYFFWKKKGAWHFTAGFVLVCALLLTSVLLLTETGPNETVLHVINESTVGHQEAKDQYGSSTFSFWGTHPRLAGFWQEPLVAGVYLLKPTFLLFLLFLAGTFFWSRGRGLTQFAFLTAAVAIAIQLWKTHAGGTYVEWYLPFFLLGLFGRDHWQDEAAGMPSTGPKP